MRIELNNLYILKKRAAKFFGNVIYSFFEKPKYLIRLDDSCETQDQAKWNKIEKLLDNLNIRPIVGVVPDNYDNFLKKKQSNKNFWKLVKSWEKKGWTIALHGYQHLLHETKRNKLIFPFYTKSEFGGLDLNIQKEKIKKGLEIMNSHNINPKAWIAPAHTFDEETIIALKNETEIKIISDGSSIFPFVRKNMIFIPQQLWKPKKRFTGIWTICLHPNNINEAGFRDLEKTLSKGFYRDKFIDLNSALKKLKKIGILSHIYSFYFWTKWNTKFFLSKINLWSLNKK